MKIRQTTMKAIRSLIATTALAGMTWACTDDGASAAPGVEDAENESYGGATLKADSVYSECHMLEVLKAVNESQTDIDALKALGLSSRAAKNVVAHRVGPDGQLGTADDDLFDDHDELDAVPYIGPRTMEKLVEGVSDRCEDDLLRPFMDANTFTGSTGGGWKRDNVELEATFTVSDITPQKLHAFLMTPDDDGRTGFETLRKHRIVEAFTYSYGIDEMPWASKHHRLRESFPHVALSIESGRFEWDEDDQRRELSLGTDYMDDVYFDTKDFALLKNDIQVRGRVRWDTVDTVRRLLIAAKFGAGVDAEGIKRAAKIDVRTEGGDHKDTLTADVQRGTVKWQGRETPVEPLAVVYERMNELGLLPDIDGYKDVLLLLPQVYLRSARSRYHMNEVRIGTIESLFDNGMARISVATELAEAAQGRIDTAELTALIELGKAIEDGSATHAAILEAIKAEFPAVTDREVEEAQPSSVPPTSIEALRRRELTAGAIKDVYDAFAEQLDDLDRDIADNADGDWDDLAEMWRAYVISTRSSLRSTTTWTAFRDAWLSTDPVDGLKAFNEYALAERDAGSELFEGFEPVMSWDGIGKDLVRELLKIHGRQIEAAGTAARTLWFDNARAFYVPASRRYTSNFLIDTMDVAQMLSRQEWDGLTDAQRKPGAVLPPAAVFQTVLVNEVQIELGAEEAYLERIAALQAQIDDGTADAQTQALMDGARYVFNEYRGTLKFMAELKGDRILDKLEDADIEDAVWGPAKLSKGQTALKVISDQDG